MTYPLDPEIRLTLSRERIRLALCAMKPKDTSANPTFAAACAASTGPLPAWLDASWQTVLQSAPIQTTREVLASWALKHPLSLVLAAAAAGGLLALTKPWRWLAVPPAFAGLLPQVLGALAAKVPPATWLSALEALLHQSATPANPVQKEAAAPE